MTKTIELTDLVINQLVVDYERQVVVASYRNYDAAGTEWEHGEAFFWVTMPDPGTDTSGNPNPIPINWFLLPPSYIPTLLQLRTDADAALSAVFLV